MRYPGLLIALLFTLLAPDANADSPRDPVTELPRVFGREAPILILGGPITVNRSQPGIPFFATVMVELPPGFFVPVSQDAEGVFYQSVKGVRPLRRYQPAGGGLYVGKADGKIWVFVGNAKLNSKTNIFKDSQPLPPSALRALYIGKVDRKK
jgi:hypothetical protein